LGKRAFNDRGAVWWPPASRTSTTTTTTTTTITTTTQTHSSIVTLSATTTTLNNPIHQVRSGVCCAVLGDYIYAVGGRNTEGAILDSVERCVCAADVDV